MYDKETELLMRGYLRALERLVKDLDAEGKIYLLKKEFSFLSVSELSFWLSWFGLLSEYYQERQNLLPTSQWN
jgi:hypothetical protein